MLAFIGYGLTFWLWSAIAPAYAVRYDVHRFANCNAAALYALAHPAVGRYRYRVAGRLSDARVERTAAGFRGESRITFFFEPRDSALILPKWSWPTMTLGERQSLADFLDRLRTHELGHRTIAQRTLQNRGGSITVVAHTQNGAVAALKSMLAAQLHDLSREILRKEQLYDRVTDHGKRQEDAALYGFPLGANVVFGCP